MTLADDLIEAGSEAWFADAVDRLLRGGQHDLDSYLVSVGSEVTLEGTRTVCRCHFISRDGNGTVRLRSLAAKLALQVVDYCIPRSRINEAHRAYEKSGSMEHFARLEREAKNAFTALENSGEGGELLLFVLLERMLGLPQLLCKMDLKTNTEMHYHGVDGVHVKVLEGGGLAIYWGESKIYADLTSAISECFKSIAPYLLDDGLGPLNTDVLLLRNNLDTGDPLLDEHLVKFFVEDAVEVTKREFRGASLIGFGLTEYPDPNNAAPDIEDQLHELVADWFTKVENQIKAKNVEHIEIEVFCIPLPSADAFRKAFREAIGIT